MSKMLTTNYSDSNYILHKTIRKFYGGSLNLKLEHDQINDLPWSKQEEFINATLNNPLIKKYPMKSNFVRLFLKKLIGYLETSQDVHDDLYKYLCMMINDKPDNFSYRHYIIGNDLSSIITLKETNSMVVNGTTGMKTWEAALILADWALCNKDLFRNKKILELGSGMGFAGITLAKFCKPETIILTDCHKDVLITLEENININFDHLRCQSSVGGVMFEGDMLNIGVMNLDWNNIMNYSLETCPDIIIGADIVYDPAILHPLCDVIKSFINKSKDIEVYIAGVLRNEQTFNMFLESLVTANFSYEKLIVEQNVFIDWDCNNQHYLLKIKP